MGATDEVHRRTETRVLLKKCRKTTICICKNYKIATMLEIQIFQARCTVAVCLTMLLKIMVRHLMATTDG